MKNKTLKKLCCGLMILSIAFVYTGCGAGSSSSFSRFVNSKESNTDVNTDTASINAQNADTADAADEKAAVNTSDTDSSDQTVLSSSAAEKTDTQNSQSTSDQSAISSSAGTESASGQSNTTDQAGAVQSETGASASDTSDAGNSSDTEAADAAEGTQTAATDVTQISSEPVSSISLERTYTDAGEAGLITASDANGNPVWTASTPSYAVTENDPVGELGSWNGHYYYYAGGSIICLNEQDGSTRWINSDFSGYSASAALDSDGTLYCCGYYHPNLMVIDPLGSTLIRIESFSDSYVWFSDLSIDDSTIYVHANCIDGNSHEVILQIDKHNYTCTESE